MRPDDPVVSRIGMATSLGPAVAACAAVHAGIVRTAETGLLVGTTTEEEPVPVLARSSAELSGFEGVGRIVQLLDRALVDLDPVHDPAEGALARLSNHRDALNTDARAAIRFFRAPWKPY